MLTVTPRQLSLHYNGKLYYAGCFWEACLKSFLYIAYKHYPYCCKQAYVMTFIFDSQVYNKLENTFTPHQNTSGYDRLFITETSNAISINR